jgi:hypothetical protein
MLTHASTPLSNPSPKKTKTFSGRFYEGRLQLYSECEADFRSACKKISSKGLCSLIGFGMCDGFCQETKTIQRQGEIFLRLDSGHAGTLKI